MTLPGLAPEALIALYRHSWLWMLPLLTSTLLACGQSYVVEVDLAEVGAAPGLVFAELPAAWPDEDQFVLRPAAAGYELPAQRWDSARAVFRLPEDLPAEGTLRLELSPGDSDPVLDIRRADGRLELRQGDRPLFTYHTETRLPPEGQPEYYRRSGFVHPVYSPSGKVLTDDFPVGHTHQHALFMAWVNTTFQGDKVDFWNQQSETGTVEHRRVLSVERGPVFGRLVVEHAYVSLQHGEALREIWTITAYPIGREIVFDIRSEQQCAGPEPLVLNEYHYGGIGFRGQAAWNQEDSERYVGPMEVLTSLGDNRAAANHTRPRWTAAYGAVDGETAGLALFDHPDNFRHPQPVRVHPEMPYFCAAPMVDGAFAIRPGETYVSRYRFVTFDGAPDADRLEAIWAAYAEAPQARLMN